MIKGKKRKALDTSIKINSETKAMLDWIRVEGETYNDIILRLIKTYKGRASESP